VFDRINLREFLAFTAVMNAGTTTAASKLLHISQPSVSRLIVNLETRCGTQLFERNHGRLVPTREAEVLLAELDVFYGNLARMESIIADMKQQRVGDLKVVATSPMGHGPIPRIVHEFTSDYPRANISIRVVPRREIRVWLENHPFDIGLVTLPLNYPQSETEPLVRVSGVCVMPADHPMAVLEIVNAADLDGQPFILSTSYSPPRAAIEQMLIREGVNCLQRIETVSAFSICNLVSAGSGMSIVDPFTAYLFRNRGLVARPFQPAIPYEFGLVFPVHGRRSALAEAFSRYVRRIVMEMAKPHLSKDSPLS